MIVPFPYRSLVLFLFAFFLVGCGEDKGAVVAEVDGTKIYEKDFQKRYTSYLSTTSQRDNIVLRKSILNNMINEELILKDVRRQAFDSDEVFSRKMADVRHQALLDAYAKSVSTDTLVVSEQELLEEFKKYNTKIRARYLYSRSEDGARNFKQRLESGSTFEELARDVFEDPGLANSGGDLGVFGWGEMEPPLEEAAFSLPVGAISDPVRLTVGYAVVKVEDRNIVPLASESDYANAIVKLARAVEEKKTLRLIREATASIVSDLNPEFEEATLRDISAKWSVFTAGSGTPSSIDESLKLPKDLSSRPLVKFKNERWDVGRFVQLLEKTSDKQRRRVKGPEDVREMVMGLATRQEILNRAKKSELEKSPDVKEQIEKGKQAFLLKRWGASVSDTVGQSGWSEQVVKAHYEKNISQYANPPEVNVAEILVRTDAEARKLYERAKRGENFAELARNHSIRLWAAKRGGELGFGAKTGYGILGEKIFAAKKNEILPPEFVDPYFGVFKILERRDGRPIPFGEAKEEIKKELTQSVRQLVSRQAIENLRKGTAITIDTEILANVVVE